MNLVTGATGLLGSHIVEQLRLRGRAVRCLVRRGADTRWLKEQGVELVEGDLTDIASLERACDGVQCVYHAAARVGDWGPWSEFQTITIDGSKNLFDAAETCGVPRFIHISSISVYGHRNERGLTIDESQPLGVKVHKWSYYTRAKVAVERELWRRAEEGCKVKFTVIRPSWLYGPRDRATIARIAKMIRTKKAKLLGSGDNILSVVYAGNVAEACILAADNPAAVGEAYNCCNDGDITQREYFNLLADALNAPRVKKVVPFKVASKAGFVLEVIGHMFKLKKPPLITRYAVWLMGRDTYFTADKARRELGWESTVKYTEGVPRTIDWFEGKPISAPVAPREPALAS